MREYTNTGNKDTRSGFGEGLTELGRNNKKIVALCADLTGSLKMNNFAKEIERQDDMESRNLVLFKVSNSRLLTSVTKSFIYYSDNH